MHSALPMRELSAPANSFGTKTHLTDRDIACPVKAIHPDGQAGQRRTG
jgi:hypothetical protein